MSSQSARPQIVVIGAGFAGLAAVRRLRRAAVDITLVDRRNFHLFQPLLYQVASGLLDPAEIAHPIRAIVRRQRNCRVVMAEVQTLDLDKRRVMTDQTTLSYDRLIVAAGSETDFFGDAGARHHAVGMKQLDDALVLRSRVLRAFEQAVTTTDETSRRRLLSIAVVGAGPTGVEYTGAVLELVGKVLPRDFPTLNFDEVSVVLIDAADFVLMPFSLRLRSRAEAVLRRRGARLVLGHAVASINDHSVRLSDGGVVEAATVVWTAGVRAVSLAGQLGVPGASQGRIRVTSSLTLPEHPEVHVIGDLAFVETKAGALPMLAPVAIQQGHHAARSIVAELRGRPLAAFHYRDKGMMATVGRNFAVVQTRHLRLAGFFGWLAWLTLHLIYIISFRSRLLVLINWGWNYLFFDRPIRLITMPVMTGMPAAATEAHDDAHTAAR